jgi:hypothetical protein
MIPATKPLPKWIIIISSLFALLAIIVSFSLFFSPQSVLKTVDLNAKGVQYLIYMWGARQFSIGFMFGFSSLKKSIPMLSISYIFFLVMNILDALIGFFVKDNSLIIGASVMCVIASIMLYRINKYK